MEFKGNKLTIWRTEKTNYPSVHPGDIIVRDDDIWIMVNRTDSNTKLCRQLGRPHQETMHLIAGETKITKLINPVEINLEIPLAILSFALIFGTLFLLAL